MSEPCLIAADLCFSYRDFRIENLNLSIDKGSFVCIAGTNGSGKSTLSRLLGGVLKPHGGSVSATGRTGLVLDNPDNMFVNPIVEDDVAFGPENLGMDPVQIRKEVDRALCATDMEDFAKKPVAVLSYGQKQKVSIAGALALKPDCLILDEVTSMLDAQASRKTGELLYTLARKGTAVVLVTHDMNLACLADRLVLMHNGEIVADDRPYRIFCNPVLTGMCHLRLPYTFELAQSLRNAGLDIDVSAVTEDELEKEIRRCAT